MAVVRIWNGAVEQASTVTVWNGTTELAVSSVEVYGYSSDPRPVYTSPIDPSDGRDVTAELNAWLTSLPPNCIADLGGKNYRSETPIKLTNSQGLTIRNGTLTRTDTSTHGGIVYPSANPHLWLLSPTNCTVENLTVRGTNTIPDQRPDYGAYSVTYEFEAAVRMQNFTNCSVIGLDADGIWGDGVQWQVGSGAYMGASLIDRVGRQGVTIIGSHILIENVQILHGRRSGFDMEPDTATQNVSDIEIRNCFTRTIGLAFASLGKGSIDNVYLHHNTSAGSSVPILHVSASDGVSRRSDYRLEHHTAQDGLGSPAPVVRATRIDNIIIRNCTFPINTTQSRLVATLQGCGGVCEIIDNSVGGGMYYVNNSPLPGQTLTVAGNAPVDPVIQ